MNYQFDAKEACIYGVDGAILISNFRFWILKNKANNKHFYDGRFWTYNSAKALAEILPFYTPRQLERILRDLVEKKVLIKGNYNTKGYDKTNWYAFADEKVHLNAPEPSRKRVNHSPKRVNGLTQTVEPIPDSNTDSNTDLFLGAYAPSGKDYNALFIEAYHKWYKSSNNGEKPKLDGGDYAGLKGIREYLTDSKKGDGALALQAFEYILQNWAALKNYRYLYTSRSPKQINSNLVNILPILREHYDKVTKKDTSAENPKTLKGDAYFDYYGGLNPNFKQPDQ